MKYRRARKYGEAWDFCKNSEGGKQQRSSAVRQSSVTAIHQTRRLAQLEATYARRLLERTGNRHAGKLT
jgi:hypothetical protein